MDKAIKTMQSEHESLYNDKNLQSKHESEIIPYPNCNPLSTQLQSKRESKLTRENPKPNCNRDRERPTKCCFELLSELLNSKH